MNNKDAYMFLTAQKNKTITSLASLFIVLNNLEETEHDTVRRKFSTLREDRREYLKRADITTWNAIPFHTPLKRPRLSAGYQCSDEVMVIGSVSSSQSTSVFEDFSMVTRAKTFITSLIKDNLNIIIDIPSTQGGTTTTGNLVRRCLIRKDDNDQDFLYWVLTVTPSEFKPHRIEIHTCLGAILRIYNSSRRVDTEELALVCSNIYQSILCAFPWANVSPTLHKLLARAPEIISMFNDGHGLENISEEGLEASNKYIRRYRDRLARKFHLKKI
ncbi:hypothetical protein LOD99_14231 [Oopsacas minuta]|uniref:Uncharacterized protein n=1 Tax=Oopsacas minuta TaxID=111878 RepID=A0AAV7KIX2_9METZ|nr:hypothetical protein LOD99_14231 [Oopsacas minuta]